MKPIGAEYPVFKLTRGFVIAWNRPVLWASDMDGILAVASRQVDVTNMVA
jgi:hypothetical protein